MFWRERDSGLNVPSYYVAKAATFVMYDHAVRAAIFTLVYHIVAAPMIPFWEMFGVVALVCFSSSGIGVAASTFFAPPVALVTSIILTLAVGGLLSGVSPTFPMMDARFWPPFAALMRAVARNSSAEIPYF